MIYAFFNAEGRVDSAHDDDAAKELPEGATLLTGSQLSQRFDLLLVDGEITFSKPLSKQTPEELFAFYTAVIQKQLDNFARTRNYDGILSAATYATSQVPKFKTEGQYAVEARDTTWAKCYEILAAVEAGTRPMPAMDELLAELPVLTWPN